jgi:hypothetical protein
MSAVNTLPSYNLFGWLNNNPAGSTVNNPLVNNPGGASNPVAANPAGGAVAAPVTPGYQYNASPGTQSGSGVFGAVPGQVQMPQPYQDLSSVYPGLAQQNQTLSDNMLAEMYGSLSPGTMDALNQIQEQWGGGEPLNLSPESLGLTDQELQSLGIGTYSGLMPTISTTQTVSPEVQAQIAEYNAMQAAAPNPTAQAGLQAGMSILGALL